MLKLVSVLGQHFGLGKAIGGSLVRGRPLEEDGCGLSAEDAADQTSLDDNIEAAPHVGVDPVLGELGALLEFDEDLFEDLGGLLTNTSESTETEGIKFLGNHGVIDLGILVDLESLCMFGTLGLVLSRRTSNKFCCLRGGTREVDNSTLVEECGG